MINMSTTPPLQSHLMTLTNIRLILRASATAYVHATTIVTESHTYWPKWTNQRCGVGDDKYKIWGLELRYILGYTQESCFTVLYCTLFFQTQQEFDYFPQFHCNIYCDSCLGEGYFSWTALWLPLLPHWVWIQYLGFLEFGCFPHVCVG